MFLGGNLVSLTLLFNFMFHTCSFSWIISRIFLSLCVVIGLKREIYIIIMNNKALQKKNSNRLGERGQTKKIKRGGVKPISPHLPPFSSKTHQKLPKTHGNHHFCTKLQAFCAFVSIILAFNSSHSSKCHLYLVLLFPWGIWCFICCFLGNIWEINYV